MRNRERQSSRTPIKVKPPRGMPATRAIMMFVVMEKGRNRRQRKTHGPASTTASTALRMANMPNNLPASV